MSEAFDPYRKWLGIPPKEQPPSHYRLLGIAEFEDDPDVIENAANRQMAHVRTFQSGRHSALSQQILNELSAARICLLNAEKKRDYDASLRQQQAAAKTAPASGAVQAPPTAVQPAAPAAGPPVARPVAVAPTPLVKTPSTTSRSRHHRARRRSSPLPIILGLIALAVIAGVVVVFLNRDSQDSPERSSSRAASRPAISSSDRGASRPARPSAGSGRFGDGDAVSRRDGAWSNPSAGQFGNPPPTIPRPGDGGSASPPGDSTESTVDRQQQFADAIQATYTALGERNWAGAAGHLIQAERFHRTDEENGRVTRLSAMKAYLTGFWEEVRKAVRDALEPGAKFQHLGMNYEFAGYEADEVTFQVDGTAIQRKVPELDARHALAFAAQARKDEDAFSRVYTAAHLILDKEASEIPSAREEALRLLREATALSSLPNAYLAEELGVELDALRQPPGPPPGPFGASASAQSSEDDSPDGSQTPPSTPDAPAERLVPPSTEAQAPAKREMLDTFGRDFDSVRRDRGARPELAKKLLAAAGEESDATARYVLLREAADQAVKAGEGELLMEVVDQLVGRFQLDALEEKAEYLRQYARDRDSDGELLVELANALRDEAQGDERLELRVKLVELAMSGAQKADLDDTYKELNVELQGLKAELARQKRDTQ